MPFPKTPFYFLRHGETDWNRQQRSMGQADIPLNDCGLSQAKDVSEIFKDVTFSSIAVSPLCRAVRTAEIATGLDPSSFLIIDDLKECSLGVIEGKARGDGCQFEEWRRDEVIEGAELCSAFIRRVQQGMSQALKLPAPVLIVSHGGVYWAVQKLLSLPRIDLPNCGAVYHRPPKMKSQPWFCHLLNEEGLDEG